MRHLDTIHRAAFVLFFTAALSALAFLWGTESPQKPSCLPYTPKASCKLGHFEIHVHDITERRKPIMAVAEGACVYVTGEGKSKRFVMPEATFTALDRTDYFERGVEIPAAQSTVCEVL